MLFAGGFAGCFALCFSAALASLGAGSWLGWLALGWLVALRRPALAWGARSLAEFTPYRTAPATCPCLGGEVSGGVRPLLDCSGDLPLLGGKVSGGVWALLDCSDDLPLLGLD